MVLLNSIQDIIQFFLLSFKQLERASIMHVRQLVGRLLGQPINQLLHVLVPNRTDLTTSVPDKKEVSGNKPYKVSYVTQQININFIMVWWEQWDFDLLEFLVDTLP